MSLSRDFIEFIECVHARKVDYLLVGGHAIAFHGVPRFTKDIDFWIRPSQENAERLMLALGDFGFAGLGLAAENFASKGQIVQLGQPPNRIDLITAIDGVEFDDAFSRRIETTYHGKPLCILSLPDLIANKRATGRPQDRLDADSLQSLLGK